MPLSFYSFLHIAGLILLLHAIGAFLHHQATSPGDANPRKRSLMIQHGIGLLVMLVAGFGMLAKLEIAFPYPAWVWLKVGIWVLFGGMTRFAGKGDSNASTWWTVSLIAAIAAAWLGINKPF